MRPVTPQKGRDSRLPTVALASVVVATAGVYALLALGVDAPRVHPDEETYLLAAASLADGHGLAVRGADYGFGPLLPILLAAIIRIAGNVDAAYDWFKTANALLFALTAVPVYLIARRLVPGWWAVLAAALSVGIPSSISIGTVMTESLSYLAAAVALSVMMVALERPTLLRQLALLSAIAVAFLARSQLGVLYVTWVGALGVVWLIAPAMRPRGRADVIRLWPTAMPVLVAPLVVVAKVVSGGTATETLGGYSVLWRDYDPVEVSKWFVYHLGDFAVYLAIVPVAVAPIVLWQLARAGRDGSRSAAAFVALFASANVCGLLVVAAFSSTPYGFERLHDRYGFYLLPLWLVGLVVWLAAGLPRPRGGVLVGVVTALALCLLLPFERLATEAGIDTVPGALWVRIDAELAGPGPASGGLALGVVVVALLAATFLLPRRVAIIALPAVVAISFAATSYFAWERMTDAPEDNVFAGGLDRAWMERHVPDDAHVVKLYLATSCGSALESHALYITEYFNPIIDDGAFVTGTIPDGLPSVQVDIARTGSVELAPGRPLLADYVLTQQGVRLRGRRVAEGTAAGLALWRIGGPVRAVGASSNEQLATLACS